jgi:hypothetical protein
MGAGSSVVCKATGDATLLEEVKFFSGMFLVADSLSVQTDNSSPQRRFSVVGLRSSVS